MIWRATNVLKPERWRLLTTIFVLLASGCVQVAAPEGGSSQNAGRGGQRRELSRDAGSAQAPSPFPRAGARQTAELSSALPGFGQVHIYEVAHTGTDAQATLDYQLMIPLDTQSLIAAGSLKADCSDLRVTMGEGCTAIPLPHWVAEGSCNTSSTQLWFKLDQLPVGSHTFVAVHFDNPSATNTADGAAVFPLLFDDFSGATLDTSRWEEVGNGSITLSNGIATAQNAKAIQSVDRVMEAGKTILGVRSNLQGGYGDDVTVGAAHFDVDNSVSEFHPHNNPWNGAIWVSWLYGVPLVSVGATTCAQGSNVAPWANAIGNLSYFNTEFRYQINSDDSSTLWLLDRDEQQQSTTIGGPSCRTDLKLPAYVQFDHSGQGGNNPVNSIDYLYVRSYTPVPPQVTLYTVDMNADVNQDGIADVAALCEAIEICDGRDNDGDLIIDEGEMDTDGDGVCDAIDASPGNGPQHWWTFDELESSALFDRVGNITGTLGAEVARISGPDGGGALHFSATSNPGSLVSFGNEVGQFGVDDFAVGIKFRTTELKNQELVNNRLVDAGSWFSLRLAGGKVSAEINDDPYTFNALNSSVNLADGNWHSLFMSRAGPVLSVSIDGTTYLESIGPGTTNIRGGADLTIGYSPTLSPAYDTDFSGDLDNLQIFHRALTRQEIMDEDGDGTIGLNDPCPLDALNDDEGDGLCADGDNCPQHSNPDQLDTDNNGMGDMCDDGDGDGILYVLDNCPQLNSLDLLDSDGDTQGDVCDSDDDGDGIPDAQDNCPLLASLDLLDSDGDTQGDVCDSDDDGDGIPDAQDNCPLLASLDQADLDLDLQGDLCDSDDDADGVLDTVDNCPVLTNAAQEDFDLDAMGDACDTDDDNDGIDDQTDPFPQDADETIDTDGDGIGNNADLDDDDDGVDDIADLFPLDPTETEDLDGDTIGDNADPDDDGDGIADGLDNCAFLSNPDQANLDRDLQGDLCDADDDADGVVDTVDNCPTLTNANQKDFDRDQLGDACDADDDNDGIDDQTDSFPQNAEESIDSDGDGKGDNADPNDDNDGVEDVEDVFPLDPTETHDLDGDAIGDNADPDDDGDQLPDQEDNCPTIANTDQQDLDRDGIGELCDPYPQMQDWNVGSGALTCSMARDSRQQLPTREATLIMAVLVSLWRRRVLGRRGGRERSWGRGRD